MQELDDLVLAAVRAAPRRHRMPDLPADLEAARAAGVETALAFAIEAARLAKRDGLAPQQAVQDLFTESLAQWIAQALAPQGGDPSFQALVLRVRHPEVEEHARLAAQQTADRRALRSAVDAIAHPGKLRGVQPGPVRNALAQLHALAMAGSWTELKEAAQRLQASADADEVTRTALRAVTAHPALHRLERAQALLADGNVRQYQALCAQRGPLAGSAAAARQGRVSAKLGDVAEAGSVEAFRAIADFLNGLASGAAAYRMVRSLRTPRGFPGALAKAKDEWDVALVRSSPGGSADIVLIAEVKASPAAATPDFARLLRGLRRLAHAQAGTDYAFASADGEVRLRGNSLRALQPRGQALPPQVIYCCPAAAEVEARVLSAATKAVLLAEPASLRFADQIDGGAAPAHGELAPVWAALMSEPRLRSALHQYDTARAVRAAMIDPQDLLATVRTCGSGAARPPGTSHAPRPA